MSKRYMDFLPSQPVKAQGVRQQKTVEPKKVNTARVENREVSRPSKGLVLGIVEEVGAKPVRAEAPKRPLNKTSHFKATRSELAEAKAKKVGNQEKKAEVKKVEKVESKKTYEPPKTTFINQEKVVKRPLSKNVYQKKIEVPKEEPKGPVTIITKPEKDAHVSLIVTIILTIILGAAAGTVAFLLLPK